MAYAILLFADALNGKISVVPFKAKMYTCGAPACNRITSKIGVSIKMWKDIFRRVTHPSVLLTR